MTSWYALFPASEPCVGWIQNEIVSMVQTHPTPLLGRHLFSLKTHLQVKHLNPVSVKIWVVMVHLLMPFTLVFWFSTILPINMHSCHVDTFHALDNSFQLEFWWVCFYFVIEDVTFNHAIFITMDFLFAYLKRKLWFSFSPGSSMLYFLFALSLMVSIF